jgi:hypothetical protein
MSSTIKLKRSLTPGAIPSSLEAGELAINLPDKKLYSSNGSSVFNVSGDQYNLTTTTGSDPTITLTVDNEALSNDAIAFAGGTGVTVTESGGTITIASTGTVSNADTLTNARDITLDGAVSGTVSFDGSQNVTITTTVADSITANTSGNAATATALETARNIGGVSFDGSADITLPGVNATGDQDTSGNAATATALETARAIAVAGAVSGTANFDGTAGISITTTIADSITANTSGNAATATALETARAITLAGDSTGTVNFDGTGDVTITVAQAANSVDLGTHTTGNYAASVTGTANEIEVTGAAGEGTNFQVGLPSDVTIGNDLTVTTNATVGGNLTVDGNLEVNGTLTYIDSTTVTIGDNMLKLANNNIADSTDLGFYSKFNDGAEKFTGLVRDATNGEYTLFTDLATEPDQTINFGSATTATLNAVLDGGTF